MKRKKILQILFLVMLILGMALLMIFSGLRMWAGLEASLFPSGPKYDDTKTLRSLRCPLFMSSAESNTITAVITNPSEFPIQPQIKFRLAHQVILYILEYSEQPLLQPGESFPISLNVSPENAIYKGSLILLSIYVTPSYPMPSSRGSCGIVVLDVLGMTGEQMLWAMIVPGVTLTIAGYFLLRKSLFPFTKRSRDALNSLGVLTILVLISTVSGFTNTWLVGIFSLAISGLLLAVLLARYLLSE